MTKLSPACCGAADPVEFRPVDVQARTAGGIVLVADISGPVCLGCGAVERTSNGVALWLTDKELIVWKARWARRRAARAAVGRAGMTEQESRDVFPSPLWLQAMGLLRVVSAGALLDVDGAAPPAIRDSLRRIFGSDASETPRTMPSVIGPVVVDDLYYKHIFDVDPKTGRDKVDSDHVSYATLAPAHLLAPLEVWEQKKGGAKTRRFVVLAGCVVDNAYTYQRIVVLRDRRILTAHRLSGGMAKFEGSRHGVPRWVAY